MAGMPESKIIGGMLPVGMMPSGELTSGPPTLSDRIRGALQAAVTPLPPERRVDFQTLNGKLVPAPIQQSTDRADQAYVQWKQNNPTIKWIADMLPISGQLTSAADANADFRAGNYGAATSDLVGLVPGSRMVQGLGMVKAAKQFAGPLWDAARWFDRGNDTLEYAQSQKKLNAPKPATSSNREAQ